MSWFAGGCLLLVVGAAWLATAAFVRLPDPLDRIHCVTFVNGGSGLGLLGASLAEEGPSSRTGTVLLVLALSLLGGAAGSFATGRALRLRGSLPEID